jgi:hypothetical protein
LFAGVVPLRTLLSQSCLLAAFSGELRMRCFSIFRRACCWAIASHLIGRRRAGAGGQAPPPVVVASP